MYDLSPEPGFVGLLPDALTALRQEKLSKAKAIDRFIATVSKPEDMLTEFDNRLWLSLVDYAEVQRDGMINFHSFDGTELFR